MKASSKPPTHLGCLFAFAIAMLLGCMMMVALAVLTLVVAEPQTPYAPSPSTLAIPAPHPAGPTVPTVPGASTASASTARPAEILLPDVSRTPGAIDPRVTQDNIESTICVPGYTKTVRPPSSYTTSLKRRQLASGYAYRNDMATRDYEEDHLISLELGGAPTDPRNLWPEPYASDSGARVKDRVENRLHDLVCRHELTLEAAQRAIATDWFAAYEQYVLLTGSSATTPAQPR